MLRYNLSHCSCLLTAGLTLTALSSLPVHGAPAAAPKPSASRNLADAFLPVPARSVEAIVAQVQADPVVRRHYARYLHLPQSRVASYLRANLVPSRLGHEGLYTVYYVRPNGLIYPTLLTLHRGSPVFALKNGPPLLTWNDGNPLVRGQRAARYDPNKPDAPAPVLLPAKPSPPRVQQIIVPTSVETTVVPPTPATVDKTTGQ